jgi:hypothetical protein
MVLDPIALVRWRSTIVRGRVDCLMKLEEVLNFLALALSHSRQPLRQAGN